MKEMTDIHPLRPFIYNSFIVWSDFFKVLFLILFLVSLFFLYRFFQKKHKKRSLKKEQINNDLKRKEKLYSAFQEFIALEKDLEQEDIDFFCFQLTEKIKVFLQIKLNITLSAMTTEEILKTNLEKKIKDNLKKIFPIFDQIKFSKANFSRQNLKKNYLCIKDILQDLLE